MNIMMWLVVSADLTSAALEITQNIWWNLFGLPDGIWRHRPHAPKNPDLGWRDVQEILIRSAKK